MKTTATIFVNRPCIKTDMTLCPETWVQGLGGLGFRV